MEKKQVIDPNYESYYALSAEERAKVDADYGVQFALRVKARFGTDAEREVANAELSKQKKAKKKAVRCKRCKIPGGNLREVSDNQTYECFIICRDCWVEAIDNEEQLSNVSDDWTDDEEDDEEQ
jgi:ribosomal protein S14